MQRHVQIIIIKHRKTSICLPQQTHIYKLYTSDSKQWASSCQCNVSAKSPSRVNQIRVPACLRDQSSSPCQAERVVPDACIYNGRIIQLSNCVMCRHYLTLSLVINGIVVNVAANSARIKSLTYRY